MKTTFNPVATFGKIVKNSVKKNTDANNPIALTAQSKIQGDTYEVSVEKTGNTREVYSLGKNPTDYFSTRNESLNGDITYTLPKKFITNQKPRLEFEYKVTFKRTNQTNKDNPISTQTLTMANNPFNESPPIYKSTHKVKDPFAQNTENIIQNEINNDARDLIKSHLSLRKTDLGPNSPLDGHKFSLRWS